MTWDRKLSTSLVIVSFSDPLPLPNSCCYKLKKQNLKLARRGEWKNKREVRTEEMPDSNVFQLYFSDYYRYPIYTQELMTFTFKISIAINYMQNYIISCTTQSQCTQSFIESFQGFLGCWFVGVFFNITFTVIWCSPELV